MNEPPLAEVVKVVTVLRLFGSPSLRMMVTGSELEAEYVISMGWPAVTAVGVEVKPRFCATA